jgi:hypothetical protein
MCAALSRESVKRAGLGYAPAMPVRSLFPTLVYTAPLQAGRWRTFN